MVFIQWSRGGDVLLLKRCQLSPATSGFYPDSQNPCSDGANIGTFSETSKFCARRMQLNLFKTAEPQPKFSKKAKYFDYYFMFCQFFLHYP
jgi:hypothetical protein